MSYIKIQIKPLSVNKVWQGRRFKTKAYILYERELLLRLPRLKIPDGNLLFNLEVGFSNSNSDIDNICKPILDILQKKYLFNDNRIYEARIKKVIVEKGKEYIKFELSQLPS